MSEKLERHYKEAIFPVMCRHTSSIDRGAITHAVNNVEDCCKCGTRRSVISTVSTEYCIVCQEIVFDYWFHKDPEARRAHMQKVEKLISGISIVIGEYIWTLLRL